MSKLLEILEREDGAFSMIRIFTLITFATFILLTYLEFILGKATPHYSEFATFTISMVGIACGKSIMEVKTMNKMNNVKG